MWLECGKKVPTLLDISGFEDVLAYSKVKGNTDVAIITRVSHQLRIESCGLVILFELKKPSRIMERSQLYKAATELVVANLKSPALKPVVVLTDLGDVWRLLWLEEGKLMVGECISRVQAVAVVRGCIQQAASELAVGAHAQGLPVLQGQLPKRLSQRLEWRPAGAGAGAGPQADDLSDCLPLEDQDYSLRLDAMHLVQRMAAFAGWNDLDYDVVGGSHSMYT